MSRGKNYIELVPQEVLTDKIFSRLPIKSLGRCKCVLKSWNSLISERRFIKTHLTQISKDNDITNIIGISTKPDTGCLHSVTFDNRNSRPIPFELGAQLKFDCSNTWSRIWGSCHGLVLAEDNKTWTSMYLLNPTTLKSKRVPILPSRSPSTCMFGFGYDNLCDDYAIVALAYRHESLKKDASVYVYMLKTSKWNKVGLSPYNHHKRKGKPAAGIFLEGSLHWLAQNVNDSSWLISAFNIAKKQFSHLPVPVTYGVFVMCGLGLLGGRLCMIRNGIGTIEFWIMKEYGVAGTWTKLSYRIDSLFYSVPFHRPDDTLVLMECDLLVIMNEELGEYCICRTGIGPPINLEFGMTYVESLVSPNKTNGCQKEKRGRGSKTIK